MKSDTLGIPLLLSISIHILAIVIASSMPHTAQLRRQEFLPIHFVDFPRPETPPAPKNIEASKEVKAPVPPPPKINKSREIKPSKQELARAINVEPAKPEPPASPVPPKEAPVKIEEMKPAPGQAAPAASLDSSSEGGGSEAGAGSLFGNADFGVMPGPGTAGGGGGTAAFGLGRDSGAPGLSVQTAPLKTNRHAKPIQTVRASYPPMALRAGLESDVALRIAIDTEGKVTSAEIIKSGGAGFDEEAVSAVKQSRFEPARRDGQYVPAEFTYIYRFRLRR